MRCFGFLTEERLSQEAARYGDVGPRPQVVWANGALASTAVGVAVDLLTDWTKALRTPVYLSYDGNRGTVLVPRESDGGGVELTEVDERVEDAARTVAASHRAGEYAAVLASGKVAFSPSSPCSTRA